MTYPKTHAARNTLVLNLAPFTFSRLYKADNQWKSTESFGRDDLLLLGKVADQTHSWICSQNQETEDAAKAPPPQV